MSVQDYMSALKAGKREYNACVNRGTHPYLPVLESIVDESDIEQEISLGEDQIPLRLVVGTCNASRTNAFAGNFMPILDWGTEFAAKWASLSDSQVNEGIRDSIKVYEYMNKFYVLEGNKRVSVLKYFNAVTVTAEVIRKVPKKTDKTENKVYYEFMDFYKCTHLNDIYFSNVGSFPALMELVGIRKNERMPEDDLKDLVSCYLNFRKSFEARGGDRFDYPVGDAFLRFIHIHGYNCVKNMSPSEMAANVAKTWEEFELLSDDGEVELMMDPVTVNMPKKNILSYLLPKNGAKKLKVGFVYEKTPQDSEWCYAHELGRKYIEDTFGKQIETIYVDNIRPEKDDVEAIRKMVKDGCDLICVTSPSMIIACVKVAIANPHVKILNCSLNASHKYIRTYYARMYEAKFLTGLIAGSMSRDGRIGYVANYPVYGTVANINAFAMGVKFVNPDAKVYLEWSSVKDRDVEKVFKEKGVRYISDQDMITPQCSSRKFGLYYVQDDDTRSNIAMPVWHWGVFYEKLIQSILSGSWKHDESQDSTRALNYWWGMSADVVELICSGKLPSGVQRLVKAFEKMICLDVFEPFAGVLIDQNGVIRNNDEHELTPDEIITMDWLLDNVDGIIPDTDMLDDSAKLIVKQQGVLQE